MAAARDGQRQGATPLARVLLVEPVLQTVHLRLEVTRVSLERQHGLDAGQVQAVGQQALIRRISVMSAAL